MLLGYMALKVDNNEVIMCHLTKTSFQRGRDFRRPEVRYDPEVIIELAGGISSSQGVNADYGDEYIPLFGTKAEVGQDESPGVYEQVFPPNQDLAQKGYICGRVFVYLLQSERLVTRYTIS